MHPKRSTPSLPLGTEIALLALMLWPAPVPIGHRHDDVATRENAQRLVHHLVVQHGGVCHASACSDDWHWHWVFPPEAGFVGLDGIERIANATPMWPGQPLCLPEREWFCWVKALAPESASALARVPQHRRYSFQAVALLHSRQSLPELLGIMQV